MPRSHTADVVIIGGGLIGSSLAYRLAQAGLKVTVLDRGEPGQEASSAAAGMLAPQGEMVEADAFYDLCAASRKLYPAFVAEIEQLSHQRVDYRRDGALLVALDDKEVTELEKVYKAQTALGLPLERLSAEEARRRVSGLAPALKAALFVPGDHVVDNEHLSRAVVRAASQSGARFISRTEVQGFKRKGSKLVSLEAAGKKFSAGQFVLAAGCWSGELARKLDLHAPLVPCRGQLLEFEGVNLPLVIRAGHHYLVPRPEGRLVAGTTAEYVGFDKSVTVEGLESVLAGVLRLTPFIRSLRFRRAWAGLRPDTPDHFPLLGYGPLENLVFATGHFRNGILLAPLTAQLLSELILTGTSSVSLEPYRPTRFG